jgi:NAD(P)-dependent dehydrogenase (short-subunit alcohol dehydrogenase family)
MTTIGGSWTHASRPYTIHHSIGKAAVHHYTRTLDADLGPYGIRVNGIAPGWLLTSRTVAGGRDRPDVRARLEPAIALRRLGVPEDCAGALQFLVTELSGYVTGQIVAVDSGLASLPTSS